MLTPITPALLRAQGAQTRKHSDHKAPTPRIAGKKDATDTISLSTSASHHPRIGLKATLLSLLLLGANFANAAPIKVSSLTLRNETQPTTLIPVVPTTPTPLPKDEPDSDFIHVGGHSTSIFKRSHADLHNTGVAPWDLIEDAPTSTEKKLEKKSENHAAKDVEKRTTPLTTAQAVTILKRLPFKPTDNSMFSSAVYGAPSAAPAAPKVQTDAQIKTLLTQTLTARLGNTDTVKSTVALMDDATLKKVVPDARLRAAILNLKGTSGEAAIQAYRDGTFSSAKFVDLPATLIADSVIPLSGKPIPQVQVNSRYQYEDFRLHSSTMAHEVLHQDFTISIPEELLAHGMDSLIHGKMVVENPSLIKTPTELTQRCNTKLMARINTRDKNGNLRIFTSQGNVYPGGKIQLANFGAAITKGEPTPGMTLSSSSPGNSELRQQLHAVTGKSTTSANFDSASEALMDQNEVPLNPVQVVSIANALKLNTAV